MVYKLEIMSAVAKRLDHIDANTRERILDKFEELAHNPRPAGSEIVTALRKERVRRFRVGEYRVLYQVFDDRLVVVVVRVAGRGEAYESLKDIRKLLKGR